MYTFLLCSLSQEEEKEEKGDDGKPKKASEKTAKDKRAEADKALQSGKKKKKKKIKDMKGPKPPPVIKTSNSCLIFVVHSAGENSNNYLIPSLPTYLFVKCVSLVLCVATCIILVGRRAVSLERRPSLPLE